MSSQDIHLRIVTRAPAKLVGMSLRMSLAHNRTAELWRSFMPRRKEILHAVSTDLVSMQVYEGLPDFSGFGPETEFERWAAAEVRDFSQVPPGMKPHTLSGGLYGAFVYRGLPENFQAAFRYVLESLLPPLGYVLDAREHFEILGAKYKNADPESEEEVWIPLTKGPGAGLKS